MADILTAFTFSRAYISIADPRVTQALACWHEAGRADFERRSPNFVYDAYAPKTAKDGKRWLKLNCGSSGVYLIDRTSPTCDVWSIKAYGVPNRRLHTLDNMTALWMQQGRQNVRHSRADQLAASEVIFS